MSTRLICILLIFTACKVNELGKGSDIPLERDIAVPVVQAAIDPLQNLVILDPKNQVHRISLQGRGQHVYADNTLGMITLVDASDPLKIFIYKKEFGTVIILDNTLSEISRIDLLKLGYDQVPVISGSSDGNIWIYDGADYRLKKIGRDGRLILESNSLLDFGLQNIDPSFIQERNGKVVLQDKDRGIFLFDNLGQYIQLFPFPSRATIQWNGTSICFFDGNAFTCYHTTLFTEQTFIVPQEKKAGLQNVKAGTDNFFLIYADGIDIIPKRS